MALGLSLVDGSWVISVVCVVCGLLVPCVAGNVFGTDVVFVFWGVWRSGVVVSDILVVCEPWVVCGAWFAEVLGVLCVACVVSCFWIV